VAYLVAFIILLILGFLFLWNRHRKGAATNRGVDVVLGPMVTLLLFGVPALTMRLIAGNSAWDHRAALTAPVRDLELVVGKWLGGFLFLATLVALTWVFPVILNALVDPGIDQTAADRLHAACWYAALVAIGVAISAMFSNQVAAFFATLSFPDVVVDQRATRQRAGLAITCSPTWISASTTTAPFSGSDRSG
jgi:ABC-2 type transport system permease protein